MEKPSEPHLPSVRNTDESTQTQYSDILISANKEHNTPIGSDGEIYNWFTSIHNPWMGTQVILGASLLTRAYLAYKV